MILVLVGGAQLLLIQQFGPHERNRRACIHLGGSRVRPVSVSTKVCIVDVSSVPPALRSGSPALFKRTIALSLQRWRKEAGLAQKDAAKRLDRTPQHISNLESGERLPSAADLELLLGLYDKADRISFMREAVIKGNTNLSKKQVDQLVDVRMGRQQILERDEDPVHLWAVLDESVLYRQYGGAITMHGQLERLLEMSERPRIDIQVLPYDAGATAAQQGGSFVVMRFPAAMENDPGLVYLELLTGGQYFEEPAEIVEYRRALTRLHALAADQQRSGEIIQQAMKEVIR
jgi:transcriptional regulator with XRE-family HTH domain